MLESRSLSPLKNVTSSARLGYGQVVERCFLFVISLILVSCNGDNVPDCFQNAGDLVRRPIEVSDFSKITVFENLNLVVKQGEAYSVEVETGEYLLNEVSAVVEDDRLILRNENGCNFVRDYGLTTIYVTAPNLTDIRSSTGLLISSDGVLTYPNLNLVAESFNNPEADTTGGSFDIHLSATNVRIVVNGIAYFKLRGETENFTVSVAAGDSRIEAENLVSENVNVNHRGSNDVFVNPQQRLSGVIRGTGNVISVNTPPEVDVEEIFNGRLIFED